MKWALTGPSGEGLKASQLVVGKVSASDTEEETERPNKQETWVAEEAEEVLNTKDGRSQAMKESKQPFDKKISPSMALYIFTDTALSEPGAFSHAISAV